ncbi:MAG: type II secretion system F family protein [Varibaculum sp.]|nr:type II secretion system F family protein [Varibaculum sp.]
MNSAVMFVALICASSPWIVKEIPATRSHSAAIPVDIAVVLDLAAAGISGGAGIPRVLNALSIAGASGEYALAGRSLQLGSEWSEAWVGCPGGAENPLAIALRPAWLSGIAPADLLSRHSRMLREDRHRRVRESAQRLAVHLVMPLGLCMLPAFVLLSLVPAVIGGAL